MAEPIPGPGDTASADVDAHGVTVQDVKNLAQHVAPSPYPDDPQFGPDTPGISDQMIQDWITTTARSVNARMSVLARYKTNTGRWAAATGSAATAVLNGATAYYVAAAYPAMAATNDQTNYVGLLRSWYREELDYLTDTLPAAWAKEDEAGILDPDTGATGVQPVSTRPLSSIPEGLFYSPNRTGYGYRAPGAERPWT